MSGNGWKKPFYKISENDSKNAAKLGRLFGWEGLEEEGKRNQDNPGRGISKAAQYAATWYLGGLLGGAGEAAGAGAEVAGMGASEAATMAAEEAAKQAAMQAAQQATQETAKQGLLEGAKSAASKGVNSLTDGVNSLMYKAVPGAGSQQAGLLAQQTGDFGAYGLGKTMEAATSADGLSSFQQALGNYGGKAMAQLGKNGPDAAKTYMKSQQINSLMNPQQPQQQQMPMQRPQQQAPAEPLQNPYAVNSMGLLGLSEEDKKRLRAMGYKV